MFLFFIIIIIIAVMMLPQSQIHFPCVTLYLGHSAILFIFPAAAEQIATRLSRRLWQVATQNHLGWGLDKGCGNSNWIVCAGRCCATSSDTSAVQQSLPLQRGSRRLKRQSVLSGHAVEKPSSFSFPLQQCFWQHCFFAENLSAENKNKSRLWMYFERFLSSISLPQ